MWAYSTSSEWLLSGDLNGSDSGDGDNWWNFAFGNCCCRTDRGLGTSLIVRKPSNGSLFDEVGEFNIINSVHTDDDVGIFWVDEDDDTSMILIDDDNWGLPFDLL